MSSTAITSSFITRREDVDYDPIEIEYSHVQFLKIPDDRTLRLTINIHRINCENSARCVVDLFAPNENRWHLFHEDTSFAKWIKGNIDQLDMMHVDSTVSKNLATVKEDQRPNRISQYSRNWFSTVVEKINLIVKTFLDLQTPSTPFTGAFATPDPIKENMDVPYSTC